MRYAELLERASGLPVIDAKALRSYGGDPRALSVQLSRWTKQGKIVPLRRGVFLLPPALRRERPAPEYLANLLVIPSYVSLERALAFHGLIPERVPLIQSVSPRKPMTFTTAVGTFAYRHVKSRWFFGYEERSVGTSTALIAKPEKALLDLVHLSPGRFTLERIEELRLQNLELLRPRVLREMAAGHGPRLEDAARRLARWLRR